ncbi:hypothetical protein [Anaerosolibacter sp.]|uniref:hypothetical protein n=1 Tax=Anaerosolibacter sp. TaxID=1872527 RepID=UPI0039EF331A
MKDRGSNRFDEFLKFNKHALFNNSNKATLETAKAFVERESEKYRIVKNKLLKEVEKKD